MTAPSGSGAEEGRSVWLAYGFALVLYLVLGYLTKSVVLNWVIGPLFPLIVLYVIPSFWRRVRDGVWPT